MIPLAVYSRALLRECIKCHVHLASDDGLYAGFFRLLIKLNCAIENSVVGEGKRIHPEAFCGLD